MPINLIVPDSYEPQFQPLPRADAKLPPVYLPIAEESAAPATVVAAEPAAPLKDLSDRIKGMFTGERGGDEHKADILASPKSDLDA